MKAIILAAGKGERLKDIISDVPKPMIRIKNKPILEHTILWLKKYGIKDVYINLFHLPRIIKNYLEDGRKFGVHIHYAKEKKILGTAGAVRKIAHRWKKDFLVVYGDNLYPISYDLSDFINNHVRKDSMMSMGLYRKKGDVSQSGVAVLSKNGFITDFVEKPKGSCPSNLVNTGLYLINPELIRKNFPAGFSDFGKDIIPELVQKKITINSYIFRGQITAIDTIQLYKNTVSCP